MNKQCTGCGSVLQTTNELEKGYIRKDKYNNSSYCERCFKIIHYNERIVTNLENINEYIITEVNKKAKYVYFLIDFLSINSETINTFKEIKVPKALVISKLDIIPKSIKESKIISFLKKNYSIDEEVLFQSSKKNINTKKITSYLEQNSINEAYILGYTNAGKSTLINKLSSLNNIIDKQITTSSIPNTTIDFIKIKISDKLAIIDSPGFTLNNTIYKENEFDLIKKVNPRLILKPTTYQLKDIASLIIEDRIRISSSISNSFTFYISNDISIERVFNKNTDLLNENKITLEIPANSDLIIKSLGFVNIKKPCTLTINSVNKNLFEVRESIFKD